MKSILHHLFIPHKSNNYRAKILHTSSLVFFITFFLLGTFFLNFSRTNFPRILGISTNITSEELLTLINNKRQENDLPSLTLNHQLSSAAIHKGNDMFSKDYWAHNSPDGGTPWAFIKEAGYNYVYAGENLARGFSTSKDTVDAWMASPSHKANLLSPNYEDVGLAVLTGKLNGEETVLIVQEFGSRNVEVFASDKKIKENVATNAEVSDKIEKIAKTEPVENVEASYAISEPLVDSLSLTSNLGSIVLIVISFTFLFEIILLERKKIFGFAKHNPDHIFFLLAILVLIALLKKGVVL